MPPDTWENKKVSKKGKSDALVNSERFKALRIRNSIFGTEV